MLLKVPVTSNAGFAGWTTAGLKVTWKSYEIMPLPVVSPAVIGTVASVAGEAVTFGRATLTGGVPVAVAIAVAVFDGVFVAVAVLVLVGVDVAVTVGVAVLVRVGVDVAVTVGVAVFVLVGVLVAVLVGVGVTHPPPTI
jgi:hypothetical protein